MQAKKPVRARVVFTPGFTLNGKQFLDVTATFNMTERMYLDRDPDMQVETEDGDRIRLKKEFVSAISEVRVVGQTVAEVNSETESAGAERPAQA